MSYSNILVAIGPGDDAEPLMTRAMALAKMLNAKLTALNVVDVILPSSSMMSGSAMDAGALDISNQIVLTDALLDAQHTRMKSLCERLGFPEAQTKVSTGAQAAEILETAVEVDADLVIVGHHRRKGLASLFSHTDESVVHRARCDVLAILLDEKQSSAT